LAFETDRPSANNAAQGNAVKASPASNPQVGAALDDPRWATLVQRLDLALGSDGQLL
jgi:hypothetical protein